jgi:hypothetical protein
MTTKKNLKSHKTSARKKSSTPSATTTRTRKAASRASKAAKKKAQELEDRKKLMELTLKGFQMTYEAYQKGKFHRIF